MGVGVGTLNVAQDELNHLMRQLLAASPTAETPPLRNIKVPDGDGKLPRLAFSVAETAEILGISKATVYRLIYRGLLRSSLALKRKIIARSEIERFLKDTSQVLEWAQDQPLGG